MTKLVFGVLLWCAVHLFPGLAAGVRKRIVDRLGEYPYKGIFTLLMLVSLYFIITGWQSMTPVEPDVLDLIYTPPEWSVIACGVLVLAGFILFLAPYPPNNFKRVMRHPQLVGFICWGAGHLVAVGTARAIVLFGVLTLWALIEIPVINRRDGAWVKPEKASHRNDLALVLFGVLAYMLFLYTHHLLFGGSPLT
jgi:uncharacterized membrane protein